MADGKITIELSVDSKGAASDISKIESQLRGLPKGEATVSANVKGAQSAIEAVSEKAEHVSGGTSVIEGEDKATGVIDKVSKAAENVSGGTSVIEGEDKASDVIDKVSDKAEKVGGGTSTIKAEDEASSVIDGVSDKASKVGDGTSTIKAEDEASSVIDGVSDKAEKVGDGTSTIKAEDEASSVIDDVSDKAEHVSGGQAVITADPQAALDAIAEVMAALNELNGTTAAPTIGAGDGSGDGSGGGSGGGSGIGGKIAGAAWGAAKNVVSGVFEAGMSYEEKLATVATLARIGNPNADMDAFGRAMMGIAADTGQDLGDVLDAAYMALSSNVSWGDDDQGTSLQNYLRSQSELAVAGRTDIATAQNATSALMNMYASTLANNPEAAARIKTIDEARIANMMVKGAYKGRFDVGTLATNMSSSMNAAASLGVAPEDIVAMYAVLTQQGISMPAADTGVYRMISSLKDNDSDAAKYMRKAMNDYGAKGINDKTTLGDLINQGYSLQEIVTAMGDWGQRQKKPMALDDMFSLAIAGRSAQGLYNARDFWAESQAYMQGDDQLVGATMGIMSGTTSFSLSRIKAQFQSYGAMLYDALAPAVHKVLGLVSGDKFQLLMTNLTNKIARFLESDAIDKIITGLVDAAGSLLDVLNGKKSWGEFFSEITGGLKEVGDTVMQWLEDGVINIANEVLDGLPDWLTKGAHIETRSEREAREKKEEAYRQWQTENGLNPEGTYFTAADGKTYWVNSEDDVWLAAMQEDMRPFAEEGRAKDWINKNADDLKGLRRTTETEAAALENGGFEAWYAGQLASEEQKAQNLGTLDQYDIYDAKSFSRLAGSAMRTQDPEALGQLQDVLIAIGDLAAGGETGWWSKGAQDYSNGVASDEGIAYAAIQSAADSAAASTEDAAAGMDDAARASSRVSSSMSGLPGTITSLGAAAAYASGQLNNVHYAGYLHAVGLDRVPYDNYPALLHKGEMVLTAAEASAYRFGGSSGVGGGTFDPAGLAMAMAGLAVQMDGRTVGRLVEKSVSQEQGVRYNRQARKG